MLKSLWPTFEDVFWNSDPRKILSAFKWFRSSVISKQSKRWSLSWVKWTRYHDLGHKWSMVVEVDLSCWKKDTHHWHSPHFCWGTQKNNRAPKMQEVIGTAIDVGMLALETTFYCGKKGKHTVDGQNPAPPRMMIIPLFIGFQPSQMVQDFFHQQYDLCRNVFCYFMIIYITPCIDTGNFRGVPSECKTVPIHQFVRVQVATELEAAGPMVESSSVHFVGCLSSRILDPTQVQ